jgi:hypothetical protein
MFEHQKKIRVKVRIYDGQGMGNARKFNIFVAPEKDFLDSIQRKIVKLFGDKP